MADTAAIDRVFEAQRRHAIAWRESDAALRIALLRKLRAEVEAREQELCAAAHADFRKPEPEFRLTELLPVYDGISHAIRDLRKWMKPRRVRPTVAMLGTQAEIRHEPRGVCLIVAPWNYPFQLCIGPLVSAIAAGNTAIIKPSEMTPKVSACVAKLVGTAFAEREAAVFEGGEAVATALLEKPFDHIFFTGSPTVGRIVMSAAARHLSSVTLELGGKSPVIVDASANVEKAARHIMWGKLTNSGQTCIAPDHAYVHATLVPGFLREAARCVRRTYGASAPEIRQSPDYCRIVNAHHFERLRALYSDATDKGAQAFIGGEHDAADNFFAPTLLTDVPPNAILMEEEIFGPLLPVLPFTELETVIREINARPKPLALYAFGRDRARIEQVLSATSAGGACVNHNMLQYGHANLPFGGVNHSGIGKAHGRYGFEAFSNRKPVVTNRFSPLHLLYPPYTPRVRKLIDFVVRRLG